MDVSWGFPVQPRGMNAYVCVCMRDQGTEGTEGMHTYAYVCMISPAYGYLLFIRVPYDKNHTMYYIPTYHAYPYHHMINHTMYYIPTYHAYPYHHHTQHTTTTNMLPPPYPTYHTHQHATTIPVISTS